MSHSRGIINKISRLHESINTAQKMKFSIKDFFIKCEQIRKNPADFVTFPERILNGKLHFLYSARVVYDYNLQKIFFPTVITQG